MTAQVFSEWINQQLRRRHWSQSDLCREAGIDTGTLTNALKRGIGPALARSIAHALEMPEWLVFVQAGILTESPRNVEYDGDMIETMELLASLPEDDREHILQITRDAAQLLVRRKKK